MRLKRAIVLLLSVVVLLCSLCGCSEETKHSLAEISENLNKMCFDADEAYEISKADIENRFNFDGNLLDEYEVRLCSDEEKYLCVAVFTLKDKNNRQKVIDAFKVYLKDTADFYSVLRNSQYEKIQKKLFYEYDDILILVVADDSVSCEKYLNEIGAKPIA